MKRAHVAIVILAGVLAGLGAAYLVKDRNAPPPPLELATLYAEPRPLPAFSLVDQAGGAFGPERLRGRWTFLFFGFVNCPDICPTTLAMLAGVRDRIARVGAGTGAADDVPEVVLVSVDPGRDTPPVLAQYVAHFDPTFTGVTGSAEAIETLTRALGVAVFAGPAAADGSYAVDHTAAIFLVDPEGRVAALFNTPHEAGAIERDYRRIVRAR
jgi:protein SCO1/2